MQYNHRCYNFGILLESDLSQTCFEPENLIKVMYLISMWYVLDFILEFLVRNLLELSNTPEGTEMLASMSII